MLGKACASVQRFALTPPAGCSPNFGAAVCVLLPCQPSDLLLVVPVPPGEAVWISLTLPAGTLLAQASIGEEALTFEPIGATGKDGQLLRSAPFGGDGAVRAELAVLGPDGLATMTLELCSLPAFNARFDLAWRHEPAPRSYGGWRMT